MFIKLKINHSFLALSLMMLFSSALNTNPSITAISDVIRNVFLGKVSFLKVVLYTDDPKLHSLLIKVVKKCSGSISFDIHRAEMNHFEKSTRIPRLKNAWYITDTLKLADKLQHKISIERNDLINQRNILVTYPNASSDDLNYFPVNIKDNVLLITETETTLALETALCFTSTKCKELQRRTINEFSRKTLKWKSHPEK